MIQFILLLLLLCQAVLSQTACHSFSHSSLNYTSWSEAHIATWCKDHDPASTSRCAPVIWPPYVPFPKHTRLHRNFLEWFIKVHPTPGTRRDCMARSSALGVNTTTRHDSLVEAVTCDMYSFSPHRKYECVCFPIFADHVTKDTTVIDDVYKVWTTTSAFYPPEHVVESCLLAAATQGPPITCTTACPKSVDLITRESRILGGGFPYCPTPAQGAQQHLAARTLVPRKQKTTTSFADWGPLPTQRPKHCGRYELKDEKRKCQNDKCIWHFLAPYNCTTKHWVAWDNGTSTSALPEGWSTSVILFTDPHWTYYLPDSTKKHISATLGSPDDEARAVWYSSHLGSSVSTSKTSSSTTYTPRCTDEASCRQWCYVKHEQETKDMWNLFWILTAFGAAAFIGMFSVLYSEQIRRCCRRCRSLPHRNSHGEVVEVPAEIAPEATVILEPAQLSGDAQTTGSWHRPADEGVGRPRVRFQTDGPVEIPDIPRD